MPTRKKTAPKKTAARKAPKPSPKVNEPSQLDRIEATYRQIQNDGTVTINWLDDIHTCVKALESKVDVIQQWVASMSQPTVEQAAPVKIHITKPGDTVVLPSAAPKPEGLQPGDYTDASKEVADALTAMGFKWYDHDRDKHAFIRMAIADRNDLMINTQRDTYTDTHLTTAEFLSRASVTAKELGLVPAEPWVPKVGEWVMVLDTHTNNDLNGKLRKITGTLTDYAYWSGGGGSLGSLRPATEQEIAAHLAEQEAKANAEKIAKLKFGVRVMTTPDGEGVYIRDDKDGPINHRVALPNGIMEFYSLDGLTVID